MPCLPGATYDRPDCCRQVMVGWTVADKLWQTDIIITKTKYSAYLNRLLCIPCQYSMITVIMISIKKENEENDTG